MNRASRLGVLAERNFRIVFTSTISIVIAQPSVWAIGRGPVPAPA
jgi:hypothetical protein